MSSNFTVLVNFNGTEGNRPLVGLTDLNGIVYGTTEQGGPLGDGNLYSFSIATGQLLTLANFNSSDGANPGSSVLAVDGNLYGTTFSGGGSGLGVLYQYNLASGHVSTLIGFNDVNGGLPANGVIDVNGILYGTSEIGGTFSDGTLYSYNLATDAGQALVSFNGGNGSSPISALTDVNGVLYGTSESGGTSNYGNLFSYNPVSGKLTTLVNLNGTDGANPLSGVTDVNGTLYGTTQNGGTYKDGVLYAYNISTGQFHTIINFNGTHGAQPYAAVIDVNGTLYGTASEGGTYNEGTVFSYDMATGAVAAVVNFNSSTGYAPFGGVINVNGTLYGTTSEGGTSSDGTLFSYRIPCFAAGTRILTAEGEIPVEDLRSGMDAICSDGVLSRIVWVGQRSIDLARHPRPEAVLPVMIEAGALEDGIPSRDLLLSPDHAVCLRGRLIPAKVLVNGVTIRQVDRSAVTYYHVELEAHAVLLAEGAPCESYLETGNRDAFANGGQTVRLHPEFGAAGGWQVVREVLSCAPFAEDGAVVEAVRAGILARAGIETTRDAGVSVVRRADGAVVIASRSAVPGYVTVDPRDRRRLGVKIAAIHRRDGSEVPLGHAGLVEGWHGLEGDGRWTDGAAVIPGALVGTGVPRLTVSATLNYPMTPVCIETTSKPAFDGAKLLA